MNANSQPTFNYDEAIQKVETIVKELELAEALSMETYREKSQTVKQLLDQCEQHLTQMEKDLLV